MSNVSSGNGLALGGIKELYIGGTNRSPQNKCTLRRRWSVQSSLGRHTDLEEERDQYDETRGNESNRPQAPDWALTRLARTRVKNVELVSFIVQELREKRQKSP